MSTFYALRYAADVPLPKRRHTPTLGRFETFEDADAVRRHGPVPELLEVVVRGEES